MARQTGATAVLPALHAGWLEALFEGPIPAETRATCADCAMLAKPGDAAPDDGRLYFEPAMKCCSYVPELHNFLTGQILSDDDPALAAGRLTVEERIQGGVGVTPLSLEPPADYALLYRHGAAAFGRSRALRCPHYLEDGGRCGVWRYRESTCSTWYCKYVRGARGQAFWRDYVHPLLGTVERSLALWCALDLGFDLEALRPLLAAARSSEAEPLRAEQLDHRAEPGAQRRLWRNWLGREMEWYRACAERVRELPWTQVLAICGPEARALARLARLAYERLRDAQLPERLEPAAFELVNIATDSVRTLSYSQLDPLELPVAVLHVLHYFHGRTARAAMAAIQERENIDLGEDLVLKLADFGLLQNPDAAAKAEGGFREFAGASGDVPGTGTLAR